MPRITRRRFIGHAAASAVAVGATAGFETRGIAGPGLAAAYDGHIEGRVLDEGGQLVNIKNPRYGAKGDTRIVISGGSIVAGSTIFVGAGTFEPGDAGKVITIDGAGASGNVLSTTIMSVVAGNTVTVAQPAQTTVTSVRYAYGTDDTSAIVAAAAAAGESGRLYAPAGRYMIRGASNNDGPIELSGNGGLAGAACRNPAGNTNVSTVFVCGDATAGIRANGTAMYERFRVDGNNVAASPMQNGKVVDGVAVPASSKSIFIGIWVIGAAGVGWTIVGAQDNSYYDVRCLNNGVTGLYIDGGAGGLEFLHFHESSNASGYAHGVYSDAMIPGGAGTYGDHTENIRFWGGILDGFGTAGIARMYLRHASDWRIWGMHIVAANQNVRVATVDLDQSSGYGIDFSGASIYSYNSQQEPPRANVQINGQPPPGTEPKAFLVSDGAWFYSGDSSISFKGYGHHYPGIGWMRDQSRLGPRSDAGLPAPDPLIRGRTGRWVSAAAVAPWSGNISYRIDSDGRVRLKGNVAAGSAGAAGSIINPLALGYRPAAERVLPAVASDGPTNVRISPAGDLSCSPVGAGTVVYLDGITFVPDYPTV